MFSGELHPFQQEAHDRIVSDRKMLLALPMGTGKTITSLAAVETLMEEGAITEPGIVLAGASLKYQWADEIEKHTDSRVLVVGGTKKARRKQYAEFADWVGSGIDYLVMTYETMSNDYEEISELPRGFVIADEVTALKSFRAKRTKRANQLFKHTPIRIGLSGTPIENGKPEELYSILQFIRPGMLGRFFDFDKAFIVRNRWGGVDRYKHLDVLHRKVAPAVVHRSFDDPEIAASLPDEIRVPPLSVEPDATTRKVLRRIHRDLRNDIRQVAQADPRGFDLAAHYGQGGSQSWDPSDQLRGALMSKVTAARMLCDHPSLLTASPGQYSQKLVEDYDLDRLPAPKLEAFADMVASMLASDPRSKVIVFSTFVGMLPLLSAAVPEGVGTALYHGSMSSLEREASKKWFKTNPECRVFISSDAGGYGVDLPEANYLINFDLPWQPGLLEQRNARPRRISSTWSKVVIETLTLRDSVDGWVAGMLEHKAAVSEAIMQGRGVDASGGVQIELGSLDNYLAGRC